MKTIADFTVEVLNETDNPGVMFGDTRLLDMIAWRCVHTNLRDKHPMVRHTRILNALEKDDRFEKFYVHMGGIGGNPNWRSFELKKKYRLSESTNNPSKEGSE